MAIILVTSRSFGGGDADLLGRAAAAGHEIVRGPSHHDLAELEPLLAEAEAWIAGTGPVTARHLDSAPKLRVVARYGVGVEAVDVAAATRRGLAVTNTPAANADAVADLAVGLMLAELRHVVDGDRRVRRGDWSARRGRELGALTVGIVGFGRIGQGVARRLSGFGSTVLACDPHLPDDLIVERGAQPVEIDRLFERADVVTLHAPGGQMVADTRRLGLLPRGAVIVNAARPELIDEAGVAAALRSGRLGGYAADVLQGDTAGHDSPLLASDLADRVTVTPHLGAQTTQAVDNMGTIALDNALAVLSDQEPPNPVGIH
jgi:phosphoglycerate dehydrogenase-like enzyme